MFSRKLATKVIANGVISNNAMNTMKNAPSSVAE